MAQFSLPRLLVSNLSYGLESVQTVRFTVLPGFLVTRNQYNELVFPMLNLISSFPVLISSFPFLISHFLVPTFRSTSR